MRPHSRTPSTLSEQRVLTVTTPEIKLPEQITIYGTFVCQTPRTHRCQPPPSLLFHPCLLIRTLGPTRTPGPTQTSPTLQATLGLQERAARSRLTERARSDVPAVSRVCCDPERPDRTDKSQAEQRGSQTAASQGAQREPEGRRKIDNSRRVWVV